MGCYIACGRGEGDSPRASALCYKAASEHRDLRDVEGRSIYRSPICQEEEEQDMSFTLGLAFHTKDFNPNPGKY